MAAESQPYGDLLQAPDPLSGLVQILRQLAVGTDSDLVVLRANGPDGLVLTHPCGPAGMNVTDFGSVLSGPISLYDVRIGELSIYWQRGGMVHPECQRRAAAVMPSLGLGLCLIGGIGVAATAADIAGASLQEADALAAGTAHELNNLFTVLGFQCELLRDTLGQKVTQVAPLERLVARGSDLATALLRLVNRPAVGAWCPVTTVIEHGFLYLRLIWFGKHLRLTLTGSPPQGLVPASTAHLAFRWALRHLVATGPQGWEAVLYSQIFRRDQLLLAVVPRNEEPSGLVPGIGIGADGGLRALQALLRSIGGEIGVTAGDRGPRLALWLPMAPGGTEGGGG